MTFTWPSDFSTLCHTVTLGYFLTTLKSKKVAFINMWFFNDQQFFCAPSEHFFIDCLKCQQYSASTSCHPNLSWWRAAYQLRPPDLLAADWLTGGGRGCRDSKDVRAHLKTCCTQIHSLAPNTSRFNVGSGDDAVLKQGSYKGKKRTPRQEPDFSLLSG